MLRELMPGELRIACSSITITSLPNALAEAKEGALNSIFSATVRIFYFPFRSWMLHQVFIVYGHSSIICSHHVAALKQLGPRTVYSRVPVKLPQGRSVPGIPIDSLQWRGLNVRALRDRFSVQAVDRRHGCEDVVIGTAIVPLTDVIDRAFFTVRTECCSIC